MFDPIDLGDFEKRTGIARQDVTLWGGAGRIVSLRDLVRIEDIKVMPTGYLERLLHSVTLVGDPSVRPFAGCKIRRMQFDPKQVAIGQTFVERKKCMTWLENDVDKLFQGFDIPAGPLHKRSMIILGRTASDEQAIAHYLPPIVERHGNMHVFMDGIHRSFFALRAHPSLEAIKISDVHVPFPADFQSWKDIATVDDKPPKAERFFNLKPELFRDLKHIGIDG